MKNLNELSGRDLKRLSAYLDGELSARDSTRLEARLKIEPHLREALKELELTSGLLSSLPQVRAPRNFTLTPEMVGIREKRSLYPVFRFASVVAAVAFAVLVGADTFFLSGMKMMSDAMPAGAPEVLLEQESVRTFGDAEAPAEVLAEEAMAIEALMTPTEEVMDEIIVEGEADRHPADVPSEVGTGETQEFGLEQTEDLLPDQASNAMTVTPEGKLIAAEEPMLDQVPATEEKSVPTMTHAPVPLPSSTEITTIEVVLDHPGLPIEPIHVAEAGLGLAALLLAGFTIYLRKQR